MLLTQAAMMDECALSVYNGANMTPFNPLAALGLHCWKERPEL
jgi:hypothetical protein